jgi:hypothetical protein
MYAGKMIPQVVIVRLGWTEGKIEQLQEITFDSVRVIAVQVTVQYMTVSVQIGGRKNDIASFNQNGTAAGHSVSSVDYNKNKLQFK